MFISRLPLCSTGAQSCWRPLGDSVEHAELSHLKAKKAAVFIHQLLLVIGQECTQILAPQNSCIPHQKAGHTPTAREIVHAELGCFQ